MIEQTLAIIRNTFFEAIRQPIMLVLLVVATIALILSNPLAAFTMDDDQRMLIDMGLATVFVCGTILSAFIATSVLTREIENRTALTVVSKPVPRPLFILGKYLGVAAAIGLATIYMGLVFMLVELQPVRQTVRTPYHMPVIVFTTLALVIGAAVGVWCNFFYNRVFASTAIAVATPLLALAYVLSLMFGVDFTPQPMSVQFKPHFWMAFTGILMAVLMLTAVAIAASTRLSQVLTLCVTLGVFMVGMLSDWFIGRRMETLRGTWLERARAEGLTEAVEVSRTIQLVTGDVSRPMTETFDKPLVALITMAEGWETMLYGLLWVVYAIVPNFQRLLLMDALTQQHVIPPAYLGYSVLYGLFCIIAALTLAVILFQRREVG